MAKELRRMGLDVVVTPKQENKAMSSDVKQVTEVVRSITELGKRAQSLAAETKKSIDDVNEGLDLVVEVNRSLRSAGAELRGALGIQTNNPPRDGVDRGGAGDDGTSGTGAGSVAANPTNS